MLESRPEKVNFLRGLNAELRSLAPVITDRPPSEPVTCDTEQVETLQRPHEGKLYVLAARGTQGAGPLKVAFRPPAGKRDSIVRVLFEAAQSNPRPPVTKTSSPRRGRSMRMRWGSRPHAWNAPKRRANPLPGGAPRKRATGPADAQQSLDDFRAVLAPDRASGAHQALRGGNRGYCSTSGGGWTEGQPAICWAARGRLSSFGGAQRLRTLLDRPCRHVADQESGLDDRHSHFPRDDPGTSRPTGGCSRIAEGFQRGLVRPALAPFLGFLLHRWRSRRTGPALFGQHGHRGLQRRS